MIGISNEFQIPVKYIGVGEGIDDLQVFDRSAFVAALFGDRGGGLKTGAPAGGGLRQRPPAVRPAAPPVRGAAGTVRARPR